MDGHAAVLARDRDHRVVLDVELLLVADPVLALEDEVGGREGGVGVAAAELVGREDVVGRERVEDRRERRRSGRVTAWRAARSVARSGAASEGQRLGVVLDLAADRDEDRLVRLDRADDVVARDVGRGDDHDRRPVEGRVEVERDERGVRVGRADRRPVPGAREDEVVGVLGRAGQLGRSLATERGGAAGASGRDRAGLDDDGAGRLGPGRQLGQGPSSMATDSITGRWPADGLDRTAPHPHPPGPHSAGARPHREVVPDGPGTGLSGGLAAMIRGPWTPSSTVLASSVPSDHPDDMIRATSSSSSSSSSPRTSILITVAVVALDAAARTPPRWSAARRPTTASRAGRSPPASRRPSAPPPRRAAPTPEPDATP